MERGAGLVLWEDQQETEVARSAGIQPLYLGDFGRGENKISKHFCLQCKFLELVNYKCYIYFAYVISFI
jgi:hypothetical protein